MGRKKVDRSNKFVRSFETTTPLDARLKKEAEKKDITISALIRQIPEEHFEDRDRL